MTSGSLFHSMDSQWCLIGSGRCNLKVYEERTLIRRQLKYDVSKGENKEFTDRGFIHKREVEKPEMGHYCTKCAKCQK